MNPCHIGNQPIEAVSAITDPLKGSFLNNDSMFLDVCACGAQGEMRRVRDHHHVSLRYFGHLRLTRQQEGSPPVTLSGLFFWNAFIQFFTEFNWII